MLVDEVKRKLCNFEACLCGSLYSTFTASFQPCAFINKRLQTLFKDQLDRSEATCSFKCKRVKNKTLNEEQQCLSTHQLTVATTVRRLQY